MENSEKYIQTIEEIEDLTPSGFIFAKVQRLLRENEDVDLDTLREVLQNDPILSAKIIKSSNSAYYGYEEKSTSLKESMDRLGLDEITSLVADAVIGEISQDGLPHYNLSSFDYLEECISTAILMEYFSGFLEEPIQDAYTIGLLCNIGKPVINFILDNEVSEASCDVGHRDEVREWEKKTVGFDHAFAGASLLKKWEFPSDLTSAVLYQYSPEMIDENQPVFDVLYTSKALTPIFIETEDGELAEEHITVVKEVLNKSKLSLEQFANDLPGLKDRLNAVLIRK
jgi:HD-like signal output (HDOD) protein